MTNNNSKWQWCKGEVDLRKDHFKLFHRKPDNNTSKLIPVALIGKPAGQTFPVQWLIDIDEPRNQDIFEAAKRDLDFFLVEKEEPNPLGYAKYHCTTSANIYSSIHWSFHPYKKARRIKSK